LLVDGIKKNAEQFLEEYRKSVEAIMPRNAVGALPFDPLSLIGGEMTLDSTINNFTTKEEKLRKVQSGTQKVKNSERYGFFGLLKIWEPWYVDIPVYETEYYTEEYVEWHKYAQNIIGKVRAGITGYCEDAKKQAKTNSNNMLEDFKNKFKQLNDKLLQKTKELSAMSEDDEMLQTRIAQYEKQIADVKRLQERLDNILEI